MKPGASFKRASRANRAHVNSPLNVYSSSGQMDISKCPSDIWICPLVQWTNGHIEISIGHLNVQSSNGRMDMSNVSITCKHISAWVPHLELILNSFQGITSIIILGVKYQ